MNWTDKEIRAGQDAGRGSGAVSIVTSPEGVAAIMTRAVELVQARGGTMTAEQVEIWRELYGATYPCMMEHITAQGATVATLHAEVADLKSTVAKLEERKQIDTAHIETIEQEKMALRAEVERLTREHRNCANDLHAAQEWGRQQHAEVERLNADVKLQYKALEACQAQLDDRGRLEQRATSAESRLAAIRERAGKTMSLVAAYKAGRQLTEGISMAGLQAVARWVLEGDAPHGAKKDPPCICGFLSGQCNAPRHPCSKACTHDDAATPGHPERVKERSEEVQRVVIPGVRIALAEGARRDAYEDGAEAMRAACLKVVREWFERNGFSEAFQSIRDDIEGAAP